MIFDDQAYELSRLYIAERHARAERDHLLAAYGRPRPSLSACAAWCGRALIRLGRRLEAVGGAAYGTSTAELGARRLSRA